MTTSRQHSAPGKTTLADELATTLRGRAARPVIRAMVDQFKRHVDLRTRYPSGTPESYYVEMFRCRRHVEPADVLHRGAIRDQAWMGSAEAAAERYRTYYIMRSPSPPRS